MTASIIIENDWPAAPKSMLLILSQSLTIDSEGLTADDGHISRS